MSAGSDRTDPRGLPAGLPRGPRYLVTDRSKVPHTTAGRYASVSDPTTWCTLDEAVSAIDAGAWQYIELVLDGDGLVAVDLDDCIQGGALAPHAAEALSIYGGYAEISMSGTGLHLLATAQLGVPGAKAAGTEVYADRRAIALTGRVVGDHLEVADGQGLVDWAIARVAASRTASRATSGARSAPARGAAHSGAGMPPRHHYEWPGDGRIPLRPTWDGGAEGERHDVMVSELGRLWHLGASPEQMRRAAREINEAARPPRPESEALGEAYSVMRYERQPIQPPGRKPWTTSS